MDDRTVCEAPVISAPRFWLANVNPEVRLVTVMNYGVSVVSEQI